MAGRRNKIKLTLLLAAMLAASLFWLPTFLSAPAQNWKPKPPIAAPDYAEVFFVGDMMFDRGIRYYAGKNGGNDFIFEKIRPELLEYDLVVGNLEGPITDNKSVSAGTTPGSKNNYLFTFDPSIALTLFENNIKIVDLGNNHILNFGMGGMEQTKSYLDQARVGHFGANYPRSVSQEIKGVKITFVSYNEFSKVGLLEGTAVLEEIKEAKEFSDIIIIYAHWGAEYVGPDQAMKSLARQFIGGGADLVIGSHPHVIGPVEEYKGKKIYYSLGNFIFDQYFSEETKKGLGVAVKINSQTKQMDFKEINFYMQPNGQTIIEGD